MPASSRTSFRLSTRAARTAFAGAALALLAATGAFAQEKAAKARAEDPSCIEVEVNGQKAPSFDCLTQKLTPAPNPEAAAHEAMPLSGSEAIAARPSNQIGLFNRAALSNRMGNTFGTSVFPQRPKN